MFFFPFRADIRLPGIPILTILICLLCLFVYWQQSQSDADLYNYTNTFCEQQDSPIDRLVLKKIASSDEFDGYDACSTVYLTIHSSDDPNKKISEIANATPGFSTKSAERSREYIHQYLTKKYAEFNNRAPGSLSLSLMYKPESFNVLKMISSAFAHGSWSHVIGNLFFFFAFAATIESILGMLYYPLIILALAIATNLVYSFAVIGSPDALPTLGLSGVVMGMMGLFTYFIPHAKIRCFLWLIVIVRRFGVYAWVLALWYFGWDVYGLYETGTSGGVNLVAHVSGFIQGYLIGFLFFRWRKREVLVAINSSR